MGTSESAGIDDEAEAFTQMLAESCQQLASMDGDAGRKAEPTDTTNVPKALATTLIDSENLDRGDIPRMYLRSTNWRAGNPNGLGSQMDGSSCKVDVSTGQVDVLRGWTDTLEVSSSAEMASVSQGDDAETYPGIGDTKRAIFETDGIRSHADMSTGHREAPSIESNTIKPVKAMEIIRTPRKKQKPPDSPISAPKWLPDEPGGLRNQTDASSICMDAYTIGNEIETTANEAETISMCLIESKLPNPPTKGANACANKPNSCRNPAETLTGHREAPSVDMDGEMTANTTKTVRIPQIESKLQNSPIETAKRSANETNGCGN